MRRPSSFALLALACNVSPGEAHSYVSNINIDRLMYDGFHPPTPNSNPLVIGWSTTAFDQGYVNQTGFTTEEIICHRGSRNANAHGIVQAGDRIHVQWNGWPVSHKGPVMDYLASCGENQTCEKADKTDLNFFKISELGLLDGANTTMGPGGLWATDLLIANNNSWIVEIPPQIKPGFYVLRTEIIALHNASNALGAQNYPQCLNIRIAGNGTFLPSGTPGKKLYDPEDPSVHLDIYDGISTYKIPGPAVVSGVQTGIPPLSHPVPTGPGATYVGTQTTPVNTQATRAAPRSTLTAIHP
ncbi:glycosyl hydrolase family 61-domain-containing protein [Hypoxylon argillaceum]|nr:glycosyl hydrolase family 61-domain-containing protein [Hypoxylon argillaceum]KAI1147702.1 glycosyl hydrolase family 61-domain-containing protein [Nemania diffusa]